MKRMGRTLRKTWQVGTDPEVVSLSRHRISAQSADLSDNVAGDVELLASEVIANAVLHGRGPVTVGLERSDHLVRVEVSDTSADLPALQPSEDLLAERGRGFLLVDRVASRWGFERRQGDGKTVWFEVEA
jgi:anti-sigma regulatory factor (Ser/Thr protein kinase)